MNFTQVSASDYIYYCEEQKLYLRYGNKNSKYSKHLLKKALLDKLFINGWYLEAQLKKHILNKQSRDFDIVLVSTHLNKNFIGVLFIEKLYNKFSFNLFYVSEGYRREGIASMLVEFSKFKNLTLGKGRVGVEGSKLFFKKHNIDFIY